MKQIVQQFDTGETAIIEAPTPSASAGTVLIRTTASLISSGTERMLVGFGKASMLQKARQQPDKVRQVLQKVRSDGLLTTIEAVRSKLSQPIPLGYCNVGVVIAVGKDVHDLAVGDRVASNGPHATHVRVPRNLCVRIPDVVSDEAAAFTVVASIGLQGMRLAQPTLGEAFVVTGAGLIGLLTVQLLRAQGCRVLAIDFDANKLALAAKFGAETCNPAAGEDPVAAGIAFSRGRGVDGVIITASTDSSAPVTDAARICRKRGRIVLVGVTGLELNRADFYDKELSFQVSCSYGPGRYDPEYEERGTDYPIGFVRWTERRNFEAVLDMLAGGQLQTGDLVTERYPFDDAQRAYHALTEDKSGLGLILEYSGGEIHDAVRSTSIRPARFTTGKPVVGFIGAGNYASRVLVPAFREAGAQLHTIATAGGLSGAITASRTGFATASSDVEDIFASDEINSVAIATRHDSHASLAARGLRAGKHVFVEKPLALTLDELADLEAARAEAEAEAEGSVPQLMVGFNRRFAPHTVTLKRLLSSVREPKSFLMLMNAGAIPPDHWTQDPERGGGRIVGEACHHIDLMRHLADSPIVSVQAHRMGANDATPILDDKAVITLGFEDGSFGSISYLANGGSSFPKERIEVFAAGRTLQIDNFRKLVGYSWPGFRKQSQLRQDKGQAACAVAFLQSVETGVAAIPVDQIFEVARVSIEAAEILRAQR